MLSSEEYVKQFELLDSILNSYLEDLKKDLVGQVCLYFDEDGMYEEYEIKDLYFRKTITNSSDIIVQVQNTSRCFFLQDLVLIDMYDDCE